jgi:hypothetical protein
LARRGRPRKEANALLPPTREPNGRVARLTTVEQIAMAERVRQQREMAVVLAQPHRKGSNSQLAESVLGRFCEKHKLRRELYDAGVEYGAMRRRWAKYKDAPMADRIQGNGMGIPEDEDAKRWNEWISRMNLAIVRDKGALMAIIDMTQHEKEPSRFVPYNYIINGLLALAIECGRLDIRDKARL